MAANRTLVATIAGGIGFVLGVYLAPTPPASSLFTSVASYLKVPPTPAPEPLPNLNHIKRDGDAEAVLAKLGYTAWVYRFSGGVPDGMLYHSPSDDAPQRLAGEMLAQDVLQSGEESLETLGGTLIVVIGPAAVDEVREKTPCRVVLEVEGKTRRRTSEFTADVSFAAPAGGSAAGPNVYARWSARKDGSRSPDEATRYRLLELGWVGSSESRPDGAREVRDAATTP